MNSVTIGAHKGLRGKILVELKRSQPLTARELAARHSVTATAIRRHLKELQVDQLVEYQRERRGLGAPVFAYRLTAAGEALFPKRYEETLREALEFVERSGGRDAVRRFFAEHFASTAAHLKGTLGQATPEERADAVASLLSSQGFMAEWSPEPGGLRMAEHNCAMHAVAARFPEVCHEELRFLEQVLGARVSRERHIVSGCNSCEYAVTFVRPAPAAEMV
ncbi:MAG TPA: HTH domain-containing protein [Gemmatimonadales bacterium]|nr:HTH domain-containing protein [Gemmatimonadales bacterium]